MDIYEQISRFEQLRDFIKNQLPVFAEEIAAADLVALVSNRVTQTGLNYLGAPFKPYSTKTVAAYRFWGQSRTQAAEKEVRRISRARGALSVVKFRKLNNLRTDKKIFEFTGEMWSRFGVVKATSGGGKVSIKIGGRSSASQLKIDENSDREGISIIENSRSEEIIIQKTTSAWLERNAEEILVI